MTSFFVRAFRSAPIFSFPLIPGSNLSIFSIDFSEFQGLNHASAGRPGPIDGPSRPRPAEAKHSNSPKLGRPLTISSVDLFPVLHLPI